MAECIGVEVPEMDEEPSDDEVETKQLDNALSEGKTNLWPDKDAQQFYEHLEDVIRLSPLKLSSAAPDDGEAEGETTEDVTQLALAESVDAIDLSELEATQVDDPSVVDEPEEEEVEEVVDNRSSPPPPAVDQMFHAQFIGVNISDFLENLSCALNRDLIDRAAAHFVSSLNKKANRKKLIQHFLNCPRDRLDLLPFYGRFLATVKPAVAEIPIQTLNALLLKFRQLATAKIEPPSKKEKGPRIRKADESVFLSRFLGELVRFGDCLNELI